MLKLTDRDIKFIRKHFQNADELLSADHVNVILDALFDLLTKKGLDDYDYNDLGREGQLVYDSIYLNNV